MTAHRFPATRLGLACLCAIALPAAAVGLGELRVHSSLGEPLDATVALAEPGPKLRADCFSLGRPRDRALPAVARATFAVEPDGVGSRVRIRTRESLSEPALLLSLNASCEGKEVASRDYTLLLDPRPAEAAAAPFASLPGDTLASLAAAIYPKSPAVQEAYLGALRSANPPLAALSPEAPIPPGTRLVLPDLRRFSLSLAVSPAVPKASLPVVKPSPPAPVAAPAPVRPPPKAQPSARKPDAAASAAKPPAPAPREAPRVAIAEKKSEARKSSPPPEPAKAAAAKAPSPSAPPGTQPRTSAGRGEFVLRLSSAEVDLSRSRGIDDRMRTQLRERLLVLDADDQVAALLSMRNSLRQLEGRVAELQLKLSTLASIPASGPATPTAPASPPPATAPSSKAAAPTAVSPAPSPAPATASTPADPPPQPAAPAPKPAPARAAPQPPEAAGSGDLLGLPAWLWGVIALGVAAAAALGWNMLSRSRAAKVAPAAAPAPASALDAAEAMMAGLDEAEAAQRAPPPPARVEHRVVADSDAGLATSVRGGDPAALRRRYIEERFPEIAIGTLVLDDADSVLKSARLFYEDGSLARAVELLQYAVEEEPSSVKPWLALFEIFRLEGLAGEFGELAARFRAHHAASDYWRKVQHIGRELDPQDPLYRETGAGAVETVGSPGHRAASVTFDPLAENWLNAPMDFTTVALAASLRAGLLADAGVNEADLVPNPMPALKNVEIFDVA